MVVLKLISLLTLTHTHTHTHTQIIIYICAHMHTHTHTMNIHTHTHLHSCIQKKISYSFSLLTLKRLKDILNVTNVQQVLLLKDTHTHIYIYIYSHLHIYIYIHIHTLTHTHTHIYIYIYIYHQVMPPAQISLTVSHHFSLSFIASGRFPGLHPVSSQICYMYVRAGRPAFDRPYEGVHRSTSLMSLSLLLEQCPACLVRLTWIVLVMGGRWLYSYCFMGCCFQDSYSNWR